MLEDPSQRIEAAAGAAANTIDRVVGWLRRMWRRYCVEFAWKQVINEDAVFDKATGLTFSTLFTFLALLLLLVYLTPQVGPLRDNQEQMLRSAIEAFIPAAASQQEIMRWVDEVKDTLIQELEGKPSGLLMIFGLAASLVIFVRSVDRNFNMIWRGEEVTRSIGQYIMDALVLIVVTLLVLPLALNVSALLGDQLPDWLTWLLKLLIPYALGVFAFTLLFWLLPIDPEKGYRHLRAAFLGAVVTMALIKVTLGVFGAFQALLFPRFHLYLVLQSLLLFLMTVYTLWVVILLGLELALLIRREGGIKTRSDLPNVYLGIGVLFYLQERYWNPERNEAPTLSEIVTALSQPEPQIRGVLKTLSRHHYLHEIEGGRYIPSQRLARRTVGEVARDLGGDFDRRLKEMSAQFETADFAGRVKVWLSALADVHQKFDGIDFTLPADFAELDRVRESKRLLPVVVAPPGDAAGPPGAAETGVPPGDHGA